MKRLTMWLLSLILIVCFGSTAYAHANLLTTYPHNGEVVDTAPQKITLEFSEPLEPDLVDLKLYDKNAHQIALPSPKLSPGNASQLYLETPNLTEGTYTVLWSVVSEDGHPVNGSYFFSVGKMSTDGTEVIGNNNTLPKSLLIIFRYAVESMLLLGAGLYWIAWLFEQRGLPSFEQLLGRWRKIGWSLLFIGSVAEWLTYSATLPGNGLMAMLIGGKLELLRQTPFAEMVLLQLILLILLVIPKMVESWYLLLWTLLVCILALGGHAWGIDPKWLAITMRVLHLMTISLWLGALTYLMLVLFREKRSQQQIDRSEFRIFFVKIVGVASGAVALTGIFMVFMQTDWSPLLQNGKSWGVLLLCKIILIIVMLLLALKQTLGWRNDGQTISRLLLRWEWIAGIIAILAGVWMSQIAYPLPVKSYSATLYADDSQSHIHGHNQANVQISHLQLGKQKMTFQLPGLDGKEPQEVRVELDMADMNMDFQEIPSTKIGREQYQTEIPFSMGGTWKFIIDAKYQDGTDMKWNDTVFISGGE